MNIFEYLSYRKALENLVARARERDASFRYSVLARAARIQGTYLSNVLHGRSDLSSDQLYRILEYFSLKEEEKDYLLLLLEYERTTLSQRKKELKERIESVRQVKMSTAKHLKATPIAENDVSLTEYYLDPFAIVVHVFLGLPKYSKTVTQIALSLGISTERLGIILGNLERLGYIERKSDGSYSVKVSHRHLPEESPLCLPHQALLRLESARRIQILSPKLRYNFSVTFSTTREVKDRIRTGFLGFIRQCEQWVNAESNADQVYQMNFDLFPWKSD